MRWSFHRGAILRNVAPLAGRLSRHVAQAPNMPVALLPRTTLPQRSASSDHQAAPQTEESSARATKQSPAPVPQLLHSQSMTLSRDEFLRRFHFTYSPRASPPLLATAA